MKTKTIFKTLALAMLMPAMMLTTACSSDDDIANDGKTANTQAVANKGYALPVTVSATRQDDGTRATYNQSTGKLAFSAGDKLFVSGQDNGGAESFAGVLDYVPATGNFSGTIYTQKEWLGTAAALFTAADFISATLLPNGYDANGSNSFLYVDDNNTTDIAYDDVAFARTEKAFVASETAKATGVEQLSFEKASNYSSSFALAPQYAILNFTISGLEAGEKTVTLNVVKGTDYTVTGSVTPNASGVATFAVGVPVGANIEVTENNLTVGSSNFTLPSSTTFAAGKIYNITRAANAINGKFTINSSGDQVQFAKGNLRCVSLDSGTSWSWSFFEHQYDRYSSFNAYSWDKFGWVGTTGTLTSGIEQWGASISNTAAGYGASTTDKLKSDWGNVPGIGSGWRTLSGGKEGECEWNYLFNTRSASTVNGTANARFAKGKVNDRYGVILFPDTYSHPEGVTPPVGINDTGDTGWNGNSYDVTAWAKMEAAGCVFLPTAGSRVRDGVSYVDRGYYWSSTAYYNNEEFACGVYFGSDFLYAGDQNGRWWGESVRLVRQVN